MQRTKYYLRASYYRAVHKKLTRVQSISCHMHVLTESINKNLRTHVCLLHSLDDRYIQAHIHTNIMDKSNFKKPAYCCRVPGYVDIDDLDKMIYYWYIRCRRFYSKFTSC